MSTFERVQAPFYSDLWQYVAPDGSKFHCPTHGCRSNIFQMSYDRMPVCNGCLTVARVPNASGNTVTLSSPPVTVTYEDVAREPGE